MSKYNSKARNSRVTKRTRFEIYAQRRTKTFTETTAVAKGTNFSNFSPPGLIFSPYHFRELQEYINNKFGITTMTSVPEYKLTGNYPPQERNNIRERHLISENFAVVSFDNFDDRDAAFEAAKQGNWNVQIFLHRGKRRAVRATAKTGLENFLERVSGPQKPNSNSANTTTDPDVEMEEARSNIRSNYYNRRQDARSTVHQNSNTNATSQLDQDVDMDDAEPILPNFIHTTPFATAVTSFEAEILCAQLQSLSI
jgi:hypothetical protein